MKKTKKEIKTKEKLNTEQIRLVENNIYLAYSRANIMKSKYNLYKLLVDEDDFDSYALEGLCYAALNFDSSYNVKFSTFAVSYIDNYIRTNVLVENSTIKLPTYLVDKEKCKFFRKAALNNSLVTHIEYEYSDSTGVLANLDFLLYKGIDDCGYKDVEDDIFIDYVSNQLSESDKKILDNLLIGDISLGDIAKNMDMHINTVWRRKKKIGKHIKKKMFLV